MKRTALTLNTLPCYVIISFTWYTQQLLLAQNFVADMNIIKVPCTQGRFRGVAVLDVSAAGELSTGVRAEATRPIHVVHVSDQLLYLYHCLGFLFISLGTL